MDRKVVGVCRRLQYLFYVGVGCREGSLLCGVPDMHLGVGCRMSSFFLAVPFRAKGIVIVEKLGAFWDMFGAVGCCGDGAIVFCGSLV